MAALGSLLADLVRHPEKGVHQRSVACNGHQDAEICGQTEPFSKVHAAEQPKNPPPAQSMSLSLVVRPFGTLPFAHPRRQDVLLR